MQQMSRAVTFREAMSQPPYLYVHIAAQDDWSLDTALTQILVDYKRGRIRQARLRFDDLLETSGLEKSVPLTNQTAALSTDLAPLLFFDLLFAAVNASTSPIQPVNAYLDAIDCFAPDDHVCVGAFYAALIPCSLRTGDFAQARQLTKLSLAEFDVAGQPYMSAFGHLHLAFIEMCTANLDAAIPELQQAREAFSTYSDVACEIAMVDLTQAWLFAEQLGTFPTREWLHEQKELLVAGEFWAEPFLILATLLFRSALIQGDDSILEVHSELETVLRARGLTTLLPAMTLLRREFFERAPNSKLDEDALALPASQLFWLMPTAKTLRLNGGVSKSLGAERFPRVNAALDVLKGGEAMAANNFEVATKHIWSAFDQIQAHSWIFLLKSSRREVDVFLAECRSRRRFVEKARQTRLWLVNLWDADGVETKVPVELTESEFAVITLLKDATSNKALARDLDVSEATVKFHLGNIYRKLGVKRRREAIKAAYQKGWVAPPNHHNAT